MEMFYRDMRATVISDALGGKSHQMRFKIDHPLCHYVRDYSHDDPSHFVMIEFSSSVDAQRADREVPALECRFSQPCNCTVY